MQMHYFQVFRNAKEVLKHATEECYANAQEKWEK